MFSSLNTDTQVQYLLCAKTLSEEAHKYDLANDHIKGKFDVAVKINDIEQSRIDAEKKSLDLSKKVISSGKAIALNRASAAKISDVVYSKLNIFFYIISFGFYLIHVRRTEYKSHFKELGRLDNDLKALKVFYQTDLKDSKRADSLVKKITENLVKVYNSVDISKDDLVGFMNFLEQFKKSSSFEVKAKIAEVKADERKKISEALTSRLTKFERLLNDFKLVNQTIFTKEVATQSLYAHLVQMRKEIESKIDQFLKADKKDYSSINDVRSEIDSYLYEIKKLAKTKKFSAKFRNELKDDLGYVERAADEIKKHISDVVTSKGYLDAVEKIKRDTYVEIAKLRVETGVFDNDKVETDIEALITRIVELEDIHPDVADLIDQNEDFMMFRVVLFGMNDTHGKHRKDQEEFFAYEAEKAKLEDDLTVYPTKQELACRIAENKKELKFLEKKDKKYVEDMRQITSLKSLIEADANLLKNHKKIKQGALDRIKTIDLRLEEISVRVNGMVWGSKGSMNDSITHFLRSKDDREEWEKTAHEGTIARNGKLGVFEKDLEFYVGLSEVLKTTQIAPKEEHLELIDRVMERVVSAFKDSTSVETYSKERVSNEVRAIYNDEIHQLGLPLEKEMLFKHHSKNALENQIEILSILVKGIRGEYNAILDKLEPLSKKEKDKIARIEAERKKAQEEKIRNLPANVAFRNFIARQQQMVQAEKDRKAAAVEAKKARQVALEKEEISKADAWATLGQKLDSFVLECGKYQKEAKNRKLKGALGKIGRLATKAKKKYSQVMDKDVSVMIGKAEDLISIARKMLDTSHDLLKMHNSKENVLSGTDKDIALALTEKTNDIDNIAEYGKKIRSNR